MKIEIGYNEFYLDEYCLVEVDAYRLTIKETDFEEKSAQFIIEISEKNIILPSDIERRVNKSCHNPNSKIYIDKKNRYKIIIDYD
jgi:hypothetical protein